MRADTSPGISDQSGSLGFDQPDFDHADFRRKAQGIRRGVLKAMGLNAIWFDHPVERQMVPDYYNVIKQPMDLGTIDKKLARKDYTPIEFHNVRSRLGARGWPGVLGSSVRNHLPGLGAVLASRPLPTSPACLDQPSAACLSVRECIPSQPCRAAAAAAAPACAWCPQRPQPGWRRRT